MLSLDHDGNGEVDFDEFLNLMTNTDVFLEVLNTDDTDDTEAKREARKRGMVHTIWLIFIAYGLMLP